MIRFYDDFENRWQTNGHSRRPACLTQDTMVAIFFPKRKMYILHLTPVIYS